MKPALYPLNGPNLDFLPDGQPRPRSADGQPLMTLAEANWHSHVSGMAAREAAQNSGADPVASSALALGAAMTGGLHQSLVAATAPNYAGIPGSILVAGIPMYPLSIGTFLTLEKLGSSYAKENESGSSIALGQMDIAIAALVFQDPAWCYLKLEEGNRDEIQQRAIQLSFKMTAEVLRAVNDFINAQMAEFFAPDSTEKKSTSTPLPSQELPDSSEHQEAPSQDGPSPSSNS